MMVALPQLRRYGASMQRLHLPGVILAVAAILIGCHSGISSGVVPPLGSHIDSPDASSSCLSSGNLTVDVRVPAGSRAKQVRITDSVYGAKLDVCMRTVSQCPSRICTAHFKAPSVISDLQVDAYDVSSPAPSSSPAASGIFYAMPSATIAKAVLGSTVSSISVRPFLSPPLSSSALPSLPIGQTEHVWVVAKDAQHEVIIGRYPHTIHLHAPELKLSEYRLASSSDVETLTTWWANPLNITASSLGQLKAQTLGVTAATQEIQPSSGIAYFTPGPDSAFLGPGPVAIDPKDGSAYFVINDESGCTYASGCRAELGRISSTGNLSSPIPLPTNVPGVSQMYFTNDGALWMATYQPAGAWSSPLPILRMAPGSLSEPSPLPASFGEASGFVQDPSGNLWISACTGPNCLPDHDGTPVLEETTTSSYGSGPTQAIALPTSCAHLGYLGFTVGDVAFSNGTLYVIGLNDGSAPPARGVVWTYPPSGSNSCLAVPNNFNPSPYFATIGSPSNSTLVFGAGGNPLNFRWPPQNGFYAIVGGQLQTPDPKTAVTVSHVSVYATNPPSNIVYYVHSSNLKNGIYVSGLGAYDANNGDWNVFPAASFDGSQEDDGVAAVSDGAWFTADSVCSLGEKRLEWRLPRAIPNSWRVGNLARTEFAVNRHRNGRRVWCVATKRSQWAV